MGSNHQFGLYRYDWTRRRLRINQKVWVIGHKRPIAKKIQEFDHFTRRHPHPGTGYVARIWLDDSLSAEVLGDDFYLSAYAVNREKSVIRCDHLRRNKKLTPNKRKVPYTPPGVANRN